ncbi:MAG: ATP-binding protein [bacterium]|nr:ATP-binding protein [bacterium]
MLAAKALFDGPELPVAVRLAEHDGVIWLDLGDETWEAVRVDATGWEIVGNPTVKFLRPQGQLALPRPVGGGSVDDLRPFVNIGRDEDWALLLTWLVAALHPTGPYPVLVLNGEQGAAKSTMCRVLRRLVDPNRAPLKAMPRDSRDLMIAATNSRLLAFDNLSHVPPWLSDALCRLATGGGFATRALYSDDQEKLFDAMRPVLLNGIEELTARPDLLDRAICLTLPQIPESRRRTELDFWREFEAIRRGVLRALLAAVSTSLRNRPTVELPFLPRMADFAVLAVAAETALGLPPGAFLAAYTENRAGANDLAIESSPIGPAVLGLIHRRVVWQGTARELLTELEDHHTDDKTRNRRDWPRQPRALGNALRRLIPNLRMVGIAVTFQRNRTGRLIYLEKTGGTSSLSSRSSHTAPGAVENAVSPLARVPQGDEAVTVATFASSHEIAADAPENGVGDGGDDSDGEMQADSKPPREVLDL